MKGTRRSNLATFYMMRQRMIVPMRTFYTSQIAFKKDLFSAYVEKVPAKETSSSYSKSETELDEPLAMIQDDITFQITV